MSDLPWYAWLSCGAAAGIGLAAVVARWHARRILARQLAAERRARAAERMAELGAMTGGLAHEIKNPLSTIGLNAQLLSEGLEDLPELEPTPRDAKQRLIRRVESLRRETERLRGILSDFLSYAGELRLDCKPASINHVVEELADFFQPQAQHQGVRLRLDLSPSPLTAHCDVPHLKQAVLNLMLNAVQAMSRTPAPDALPRELILQTRAVEAPPTRPAKDRASSPPLVSIRVTDTGPGMAPDTVAKLFTPYFTTRSGGSGLGLATSRRIIEAMAGRIAVQSEIGKGASFQILLPASLPLQNPAPSVPPVAASPS